MKVTQWFGGEVRPMYIGWYETRFHYDKAISTRWWDGKNWSVSPYSSRVSNFGWVGDHWRGVAK